MSPSAPQTPGSGSRGTPPQAAPATRPAPTASKRTGFTTVWLLVDGLVIGALSIGGATWFMTTHSGARLAGGVVSVVMGVVAGGLAFRALRPASQAAGSQGRSTGARARRGPSEPRPPAGPIEIDGERLEDLRAVGRFLARRCYTHADGSGPLRSEAARQLLLLVRPAALEPLIAASEVRAVSEFQRLLARIAGALGEPVPPALQTLRDMAPAAAQDNLLRAADALAAATELNEWRDLLVENCFEHADGRGWVATWGLPVLLSQETPEHLAALFTPARPKMVLGIARLLAGLARHQTTPCAELDAVRAALIDVGRVHLPHSQQVEWIIPFVTGVCCERADGGGRVDREGVRRLFDKLPCQAMARRLGHISIRELNEGAAILGRLAQGAGEPLPDGLRALLHAFDEAIELAAIQAQPRLVEARDLAALRKVLIETCCESDGVSGYHSRRALGSLFDGIAAERFAPLVADASPGERLLTSQLLSRLDVDRHVDETSAGASQLRAMLAAAVERDRELARRDLSPTFAADGGATKGVAAGPSDAPGDDAEDLADEESSGASRDAMTWPAFKRANLDGCSAETAQRVAQLLDEVGAAGDEGLTRLMRRLWKGLRRDSERLVAEWTAEQAAAEWARKRFLAEAMARRADRRTISKLMALLEGACDDPQYRDEVQPAIARALAAIDDRRAADALKRVQAAPHISPATRKVIAAAIRR